MRAKVKGVRKSPRYIQQLNIALKHTALILSALFLSACSNKPILYKEVYIPTKCDIPKREKPKKEDKSTITFLKEVLIYSDGLERDLAFCRGEDMEP